MKTHTRLVPKRALWLFALLALAACNLTTTTPTPQATLANATQPVETETPLSTATPQPSPTPTGFQSGLDKELNPLTGLPMNDPSILERRPVAVKITLYPRTSRPQWGLSLADIVYEYYHNNELTRFHAIFYGQDASLAGPIRSARLPDDQLADMYGSLLTYASADSRIRDRLAGNHPNWQLVSILEGECPPRPVCRYDPQSYNHLLANTAEIGDYVEAIGGDDSRQPLEGMHFAATRPKGGEDVEQITTRYSYGSYNYWEYDPEAGRYLRYQDVWDDVGGRGEQYTLLVDRLTGEPFAVDNVVVLYVPHFHLVYKPPSSGVPATEIVDMDLTGGGPAYAFRDGQAYEVQWVVKDGQVLALEMPDGSPYPFKPGTTFFQVLNDDSTLQRDESAWRFTFEFPPP